MVAGRRRGGKPRTEAERRTRHGGEPPPRGTGIFCRRLDAVIADEAGAKSEYDRLLTYAPGNAKPAIKGIQRDETGHRQKLIKMREKYCK